MGAIADRVIRLLCERVAARVPHTRVRDFVGTTGRYLTRYTLLGDIVSKHATRLGLHHFWRGDEDRAHHNHPWRFGVALILVGGYRESSFRGDAVVHKDFRPGQLNFLYPDLFHRVELLDPRGCWTLILTGPVVQSWGFRAEPGAAVVPWREFLRAKGLAPDDPRRGVMR